MEEYVELQIYCLQKDSVRNSYNICQTKAVPLRATKALGGEKSYRSYSFLTSALDGRGVSGQRHALAAIYPRKKDLRHPLYRRRVGPRAGLNTDARQKILLPPPGIEWINQ
jgi:hypothetical protein